MKPSKKFKRVIGFVCISAVISLSYGCGIGKDVTKKPSDPNEFYYNYTAANSFVPSAMSFNATSYKASVKPYTIKADLTNVANNAQFGQFTAAQKHLLTQNSFCVVPSKDEQLFYTYENNAYLKVPSFITCDSVLQLYNVFFDYSLRSLESKELVGKLVKLTDSMLRKQMNFFAQLTNPTVKEAALSNVAYFEVAHELLTGSASMGLDAGVQKSVKAELGLIMSYTSICEKTAFL